MAGSSKGDIMDKQQAANEASTSDLHAPIRQFSGSHDSILTGLRDLAELPALALAMEQARSKATALLDLFDRVVRAHHVDEEQELFVSVQRSCSDAREATQVQAMVDRLTAEHREIEALWKQVRPAVQHVAAGKVHGPAFTGDVDRLVRLYGQHAHFEEEVFLPLADTILSRNANHMAALDIALHLRHAPPPRGSYI
jgi:hemerythrin-like domain-containing protein